MAFADLGTFSSYSLSQKLLGHILSFHTPNVGELTAINDIGKTRRWARRGKKADLLAIDKTRYFAQPSPTTVKYNNYATVPRTFLHECSFSVCGLNPMVGSFKRHFFGSIFTWWCLFVCFLTLHKTNFGNFKQNKFWKFCWVLPFATFGSEWVLKNCLPTPPLNQHFT